MSEKPFAAEHAAFGIDFIGADMSTSRLADQPLCKVVFPENAVPYMMNRRFATLALSNSLGGYVIKFVLWGLVFAFAHTKARA